MVKAIFIGIDEMTCNRLCKYLTQSQYNVAIIAKLTIDEMVSWLFNHREPDLIFMCLATDVDRILGIYNTINISIPVIVIYEGRVLPPLDIGQTCIHYLSNPVNKNTLSKALNKYYLFLEHFVYPLITKKRCKFIALNDGIRTQLIQLSEIACFIAVKDKTLITTESKTRLSCRKKLAHLEPELNPDVFYRISDKSIINLHFVKSYQLISKRELLLKLDVNRERRLYVSPEHIERFLSLMASL